MRIEEVIWIERFVEKLEFKHGVATDEVEEILMNEPFVRKQQKVILGERIYMRHMDKRMQADI